MPNIGEEGFELTAVVIEWDDPSTDLEASNELRGPSVHKTIGWLAGETDDAWHLVSDYDINDEEGQIRHRIPKRTVIKMSYL